MRCYSFGDNGLAGESMGRNKQNAVELAERRRSQIADAAIELFSRAGYHPTTIREVADEAGVSIGMIYQYFQDKEELLFFSLQKVLNTYRNEIPSELEGVVDALEGFCTAVHAYGKVQARSVDATVLTYRETKSLTKEHRNVLKQLEYETNELIAARIRDCIEAGIFVDTDTEILTYQIVLYLHGWSLKAWHFAPRMTIEEYIDRGLKIILDAVLTGRGERHYKLIRENFRAVNDSDAATGARRKRA
jgi:AcrR family transcriptional regulator